MESGLDLAKLIETRIIEGLFPQHRLVQSSSSRAAASVKSSSIGVAHRLLYVKLNGRNRGNPADLPDVLFAVDSNASAVAGEFGRIGVFTRLAGIRLLSSVQQTRS
jgi:hypothetical protein